MFTTQSATNAAFAAFGLNCPLLCIIRNLSAIQDREICCYSISCKEKDNIGTEHHHTDTPRLKKIKKWQATGMRFFVLLCLCSLVRAQSV